MSLCVDTLKGFLAPQVCADSESTCDASPSFLLILLFMFVAVLELGGVAGMLACAGVIGSFISVMTPVAGHVLGHSAHPEGDVGRAPLNAC